MVWFGGVGCGDGKGGGCGELWWTFGGGCGEVPWVEMVGCGRYMRWGKKEGGGCC